MFKFIDTLRKKPEKKKQGIVLAVSFSITFIIAIFWIIALVLKVQQGGFTVPAPRADLTEVNKSAAALKNSWDTFLRDIHTIGDTLNSTSTEEATTSESIQ